MCMKVEVLENIWFCKHFGVGDGRERTANAQCKQDANRTAQLRITSTWEWKNNLFCKHLVFLMVEPMENNLFCNHAGVPEVGTVGKQVVL